MELLSKRDTAFFDAAKSVSTLSDHKFRIGAIIVDKHRIISSGCNSNVKCHPVQMKLDRQFFPEHTCNGKLHAEVAAIIPLLKYNVNLSRATLYTYRELKNGNVAPARPCPRCMQLIKSVGIKRIKYTTYDGYANEVLEVI